MQEVLTLDFALVPSPGVASGSSLASFASAAVAVDYKERKRRRLSYKQFVFQAALLTFNRAGGYSWIFAGLQARVTTCTLEVRAGFTGCKIKQDAALREVGSQQ